MKLLSIPSLKDNYIWLLHNKKQCIIIDPGEAQPILKIIKLLNLTLIAIFLTHHHNDHTKGISEILIQYNNIPIYGPQETKIKGSNIIVTENDSINILNLKFTIFSFPGHTLGHIGFYSYPWLFCGDTIFSGGCGKILENTEQIMYQSLQKIKKLNKNTLICSGHEYTLPNIKFSISILPEDKNLTSYYKKHIKNIRKKKQPNLPTTLKNELKINLFLRCHETTLKEKLGFHSKEEEWKIFSKLRKKRNNYI